MDNRFNNRDQMRKTRNNKRKLIIGGMCAVVILILGVSLYSTFGTQSGKRWFKSVVSDYTGGLNRTVTVYDNNSNVIKEWHGKIDVEENDYGNKVLFDLDGKRKTVYNAIVIIEEE